METEKKERTLFLVKNCLTPFEDIPNAGILCEGQNIIGVGGRSAFSEEDPGLKVVDLPECYAMPGFIDSHIHGIAGWDLSRVAEDKDTVRYMRTELIKRGVTTFIPTVVSRPKRDLLDSVESLATALSMPEVHNAAPFMHVEGPFFSMEKRGSQDPAGISKIDMGYAREIVQAGHGKIKLMTIAPELADSEKLIEYLMENGIIPSMGHSMATAKDTIRAIEQGCRRCTYIFNGMPDLNHRESSLTDIALTDDRVSVEIICDGIHIHPGIVDLTVRCKPKDKIIGISNAVSTRTPYDPELHAVKEVSVQIDNRSRGSVMTTGGVISGAMMTLEHSWLQMMKFIENSKVALESGNVEEDLLRKKVIAAASFTKNPAQDLGLYSRGEISPGKLADMVFLDQDNTVCMTVFRGKILYDNTHDAYDMDK